MQVDVLDFVAGAKQATGVVVIIDVFRAFSVACYAYANGAKQIIPVGAVEQAINLREEIPGSILIGERSGKMLPGFDFGNSPTEIKEIDFSNKTIIHTTHSGTQGLVNTDNAEVVFTGAFVNAKATAEHIKSLTPQKVSLVRMGWAAITRSDEDDLCAEYLESLLTGKKFDIKNVRDKLKESPCSDRFFDPQKPWSPPSDFELCLMTDSFNFALEAYKKKDRVILRKII